MSEILDAVIDELERGGRVALVTVVRSVGSTPRHCAARLAVFCSGQIAGSIGGGTMERRAVQDALEALRDNKPRLVEYNLVGGEGNLGLCGGTAEVFIDILDSLSQAARQLRTVRAALANGDPVVSAVIVRAEEGLASIGARQVIQLTGKTEGFIGDAWLEEAIVTEARRVMSEHYPQRLGFDPVTGAVKRLMATRRATVEIFLDLFEPRPRLLIIGAGHIGAALAKQGRILNWQVEIVDDRPDFLTQFDLPDADATWLVDYDPVKEELRNWHAPITNSTAVVVATWGWDQPALKQLAGAPAYYIGLVASLRKATVIFNALRDRGVDPNWLSGVRVPVGLDVGAETAEEIALSIMAEILAVARGKSGRPLQEVRGARVPVLTMPAPATRVQADA